LSKKYSDGKLCDWLEQGFSSCSLNGSICCCPFSKKGCEIQCEQIFKEKPEGDAANRYKSDSKINADKTFTKTDIFKRVGIKKGMIVADWFIPYSKLDEMIVEPSDEIEYGIEMVKKKFGESEYLMNQLRIYHNVEIVGQAGIYIIGIN